MARFLLVVRDVAINEKSSTPAKDARSSGERGRPGEGRPAKRARGDGRRQLADAPAIAAVAVEPDARSRHRRRARVISVLRAADEGDFAVAIPEDDPAIGEIAQLFNSIMRKQRRLVDDLVRVSSSVGREGKLRERLGTQVSRETGPDRSTP